MHHLNLQLQFDILISESWDKERKCLFHFTRGHVSPHTWLHMWSDMYLRTHVQQQNLHVPVTAYI